MCRPFFPTANLGLFTRLYAALFEVLLYISIIRLGRFLLYFYVDVFKHKIYSVISEKFYH